MLAFALAATACPTGVRMAFPRIALAVQADPVLGRSTLSALGALLAYLEFTCHPPGRAVHSPHQSYPVALWPRHATGDVQQP